MTTHEQWLTCTDPCAMLRLLRDSASDRKARLLACAFCRRVWRWLTDGRSRWAVEAVEYGVDHLPPGSRRVAAHGLAGEAREVALREALACGHDGFHPAVHAANAAHALTFFTAGWAAAINVALGCARVVAAAAGEGEAEAAERDERAAQAALVRDVFGSPFVERPESALRLGGQGRARGAVRHLAEGIYQERGWDRMPALAEALEDAGSNDAEVLSHCRSGGEHARGCWLIDWLTGRA